MDVLFFLRERTKFIHRFYEATSQPLNETKRKIIAGEPPFDSPPESESGEPPYLEEYSDAEDALEVLGRNCISMLSESLKLYFTTWEWELWGRRACSKSSLKTFKEQGFLHGYKECFSMALKIDWTQCPADFSILDQVVLARNADHHPGSISSIHVNHNDYTRKRHPRPFFVSDIERKMFMRKDDDLWTWLGVTLHVSKETLLEAIRQVELLTDWLEEKLVETKYGSRSGA